VTFDVLEAATSFLKLSGVAYIWKIQVGKEVTALQVLRSDKMEPKYSVNGKRILGYEYRNGTVKATFKPEELIVITNFSPKSGTYGDIQAAAIAIDTDNAASTWNWKYYENDASAGTVLQTAQKMNKDQLERVEEKRLNKHKGVNNRGKLAILHGGLTIANANPSQKEMDFVLQRGFSRDEILAAFKVPKAMLGMGEGVNVGNVEAFSIIFAKNVLLPLCTKFAEALTKGLANTGEVIEFTGVVPESKDQARQDRLSRAITLNEYRRIL
jgi:HK97 family phage portal protein